jgi:nitronate monooxygenase
MSLPVTLQNKLSAPILAAPMFIVSGLDLVIAQCRAGIIGSFPALNARTSEELDEWLGRLSAELGDRPYAVNLIVHSSNPRLEADLALCAKHRVPVIITSLQAPGQVVEAAHGWGGVVFHDVISLRHARKAIQAGVDGLILVAAGAGGHSGALSPFALTRELRHEYDGTIILSGSITDGHSVVAALAMGADLAYIGTRFIATAEANAVPDYKTMIVESSSSDIVYTSMFTGVWANYLKPTLVRAGLDPDNLPVGDKAKMSFASSDGSPRAKAWKDIWGAGQGAGAIRDLPPTGELIARIRGEIAQAQAELAAKLDQSWSRP